MVGKPDKVSRLLAIQQDAIRRSARWWMEAIERLQSGDLDVETWTKAQKQYLKGCREDIKAALALLPLGWEPSGGEDSNEV